MPSYHIWIRKEDEAKWKAIENKPKWLHSRLNDEDSEYIAIKHSDGNIYGVHRSYLKVDQAIIDSIKEDARRYHKLTPPEESA